MSEIDHSAFDAELTQSPRLRWWTRLIRLIEGKTTLIRSILFNVLVVLAMIVIVPVMLSELASDRVTITTISVPAALEEKGLNGTVIGNRLWDAWSKVTDEVKAAKETRDVLPSSQRIEFSIPDSGISFESLIHHVRAFFGRAETRISGELTCVADPCTIENSALRLRIIDKEIHVIDLPPPGNGDINLWFRKAVAEALMFIDPVRGILALRSESETRTIAELRRLAREGHPDAAWALTVAAQLTTDRKEYDKARALADEALRLDKHFVDALITRAAAELGAGDVEEARKSIAEALRLSPRNAQAYKWRGEIAAHAGDHKAAAADLARAVSLQPQDIDLQFRLGMLQRDIGDPVAAAMTFDGMLEIDPNSIIAHQALSLMAIEKGDIAGLVSHKMEIARLAPKDADALAQLGNAQMLAKQFDTARASFESAVQLAPAQPTYRLGLGDAALAQQDGSGALAAFKDVQRLDPLDRRILFRLGRAFMMLGQTEQAHAAFRSYIEAFPQEPDAIIAHALIGENSAESGN
ncbi:MAG: hypothetical protein BGO05_18385 [Rhizobiales bacterium 63-7]|nr:tetratricopeptide repeat protein [Hyphomicrobiales bacterium]OJU69333.1 MAG: hypothetical protein BGO05_18385 [Rhizobiales bacterium 63-7]